MGSSSSFTVEIMQQWEKHCRDTQCTAEAEGLTRAADGLWSCPLCWSCNIQSHSLEQHMSSKYHRNRKAWEIHRISLETKKANGEMPWWMDIKGYHEYCTICKKTAHHSHVSSDTHRYWIKNAEEQRGITHQRSDGSDTLTISPPPHWGDHTLYKWETDSKSFRCVLCLEYADDNHVKSAKHCNNVAWRSDKSNCCLQDVMPPPPPPPPPPSYQGAYTVASSSHPLSGVHSESGDSSSYRRPSPLYPAQVIQTLLPPGLTHSTQWESYASEKEVCQSSDAYCVKPALPLKSSLKLSPPSNPGCIRYVWPIDEANTIYWWDGDNGSCFLESNPEPWSKHRNSQNNQDYWWNSEDNTWFYVHSGSMDVITKVSNEEKKVRFDY